MNKEKTKFNKKTNTFEIALTNEYFKALEAPSKQFSKAAKSVLKDIEHHFKIQKNAWPLDYSFHINDVFYKATGHHLENYLLKELFKKEGYVLKTSKNPGEGLVIHKEKRARSNRKTK